MQHKYVCLYHSYTPLLKRMQLTYTVIGKIYRSCQKHGSLSLHCLPSTGRLMLHVSLTTSLKPRLRTAQTTQNTIENNCTISQAQNTTALQPNVFLTGIHRLMVRDNRRPAFPTVNTLPMSTTNTSVSISPKVMFRENCKMRCD